MKNTFKRATAVITTVVFMLTLFVGAAYATFKVFPDAENHWARETIEKLSQEGIVKGYPDGSVRPDENITRSEFVSLLTHSLKYDEYQHTDADTFNDTDKHWAENMIEALVKNKIIIKEYYGKSFKPNQPIRRIEMIRMIVNSLGKADMVKSMTGDTIFIDDVYISKEDRGYINVAVENGLSFDYPDKSIRPMAYSTRAEAFTMILRCLEAIKHVLEENDPDNSLSFPSAEVEITLPNYSHTDTTFEVKTNLKNVKSLEWTIQKKDTSLINKDEIEGTLDKDGGKICIKSEGDYQLTAIAINYGNQKFTFSKSIKIYPVTDIGIELDDKTHIDKKLEVKASAMTDKDIIWSILKDGNQVTWSEYVDGELNNDGGFINFKEIGNYTLVAFIVDETNREFLGKKNVEVLPVPMLTLNLQKIAHTDSIVNVMAESKDLGNLDIAWQLEKDKKQVDLKDYVDGNITNEGGNIQFKVKGQYTLSAIVTDQTGRTFKAAETINVYPVASFNFSMPETTHTDKEIEIKVTSSEIGDMKAVWSITKNGKDEVLPDCIEGSLSNAGGIIRFKEKGVYTLKASLIDQIGREFSSEESTVVYPVATTGFYLPEITHTDSFVEVKTSFKETKELEVNWSLTKDGKEVAPSNYIAGILNNNGGTICFKEKGNYSLKAAVTDITGRSFEYSSPVLVYPVITISYEMEQISHTDETVVVHTQLSEAGALPISWSITEEGAEVAVSDYIEGTLENAGGNIQFTQKGSYMLIATISDETGMDFICSKEIKVYPVPKLLVDLPEGAHTDDLVTVSTSNSDMDGSIVNWFVDDTHGFQNWGSYIDGELTNNGGDIRFKSVGTYEIEARITDETGRVFKFKSDNKIEIYPVLSFQFSLPETAYTDVNVEITTSEDAGILPLEWSLARNGQNIKLDESINGTLNSQGGRVQFLQEGEYLITAAMSDALGRIFSDSACISIYPPLNCDFSIPSSVRTGASFEITVNQTANRGNKDIVWSIEKDGVLVPLEGNVEGDIGNHGGTVTINSAGDYMFIATVTNEIGRTFTSQHGIKIVNTAPTKPIANVSVTRNYKDGKFLVEISAISTDSDGDVISYEYIGKADDNYYAVGSYTIKVRAKDNFGGVSDWTDIAFSVNNAAPTKPSIVADVIRNAKDGKFLVNISVNSTDADGDAITYEYDGKSQDNYYSVGANTVKVRAKDNFGGISAWSDVTFIIKSSEPTAPVITRTPNGNSVAPGTPVTITAVSTDADGDAIIYVWDNRPSQTYVYPLGKNVVKVKAVDSTGAESPWSAIAFFVSDSTNGGGMTLTGPDSVIMENGIEGATITHYTFTVPPVSGHSGSDYGRVRGYNIKTNTWEQLDYRTTTNGITFERNLSARTYSKLEFYYYTNHNCMYGKSNITYSVDYYFE